MKGYIWSLVLGAIFVVAGAMYWGALADMAKSPMVWSSVMSILSATAMLFLALGGWGYIGLALSKAKEHLGETLAQRAATISRKSWHYWLQARVCYPSIYGDIADVRSDCEYWARLVNGLVSMFPMIILLKGITILVMAIGWFFGARPSRKYMFHGTQWKGPTVLALIVVAGVSIAIWRLGFPSIPTIPTPSPTAWRYVIAALGLIAGGCGLYFLWGKFIWPALRDLVSFIGAKLVGRCRLITFTD